nr:MAG TPA: hypothetical protein [Bacteriophage sp.]
MRISWYRIILSFRLIYRSGTHFLIILPSILFYSSTIIESVHLIKIVIIFWSLPTRRSVLPFFLVYATTSLLINKFSCIFVLLVAIFLH